MRFFFNNFTLNLVVFSFQGQNGSHHFEGNFREAIWPILVIAQFFGVMPVVGVKSRSITDVHFKWKSVRTFYSLFVISVITSYTLCLIWNSTLDFFSVGLYSNNHLNIAYEEINTKKIISF